jgi:c-di-GMP-binding flagellar brake protein YcgR
MKLVLKIQTFHQTLNIQAKVVRQFKSAVGYQYGLSFVNLLPADQDKIVRYILHESVRVRSISAFLSSP